MPAHTNRLTNETSPYLLQHAHNPVDWYPWGEEAFARARSENKPIFLSIGYSACHWCHVMEHESFENEAIAEIMNRYFINIKVDREERPDLDDIYMSFVQMTTGSGGWPMSVWLTPERRPFFGGTYFPPEEAYGRRGFPEILHAVAAAWETERDKIIASGAEVVAHLQAATASVSSPRALSSSLIDTATQQMLQRFDPVEGGFGGAPKFPPSYALSLLLRQYRRGGEPRILRAVTHTLDKMASGGIYDHLGGGFHRYSVDAMWLIPHFEKMLYDNALLAVAYCDAFQATGRPLYQRVVSEILDYILSDMADEAGGFHSAEDADSDGEEGKFYVWTPEEINSILGAADGRLFCDYYGVDTAGNFEHQRSILNVRVSASDFAPRYHFSEDSLLQQLEVPKRRLREERDKRVRPFKDDKVLAEWNGLMLSALARGYQISGERRYLDAATRCAEFVENTLLTPPGLMRVYRRGVVKQPAFLTDYAFIAAGLIDLYESGFELRWLQLADRLVTEMIARFLDSDGGFYMTQDNQSDLLLRQKDSYDGATPSGNSVAAMTLLRLSQLLDNQAYRELALKTIAALGPNAERIPTAYMNLLNALDYATARPLEIAIVGPLTDPSTQALLQQVYSLHLPNRILAHYDPTSTSKAVASGHPVANPSASPGLDPREIIPLLRDRDLQNGRPTAYVCEDFVCNLPVTTPADLAGQLRSKSSTIERSR